MKRCEGCPETQPDWDKLSKLWENHKVGLVAEVFCDSEDGEPMCDVFEVAGFPSVYYGDPQSPEIYTGKLDFDSLSKLANEHISTLPCSVRNLHLCDEATKKIVEKLQKKSQVDLEKLEKFLILWRTSKGHTLYETAHIWRLNWHGNIRGKGSF